VVGPDTDDDAGAGLDVEDRVAVLETGANPGLVHLHVRLRTGYGGVHLVRPPVECRTRFVGLGPVDHLAVPEEHERPVERVVEFGGLERDGGIDGVRELVGRRRPGVDPGSGVKVEALALDGVPHPEHPTLVHDVELNRHSTLFGQSTDCVSLRAASPISVSVTRLDSDVAAGVADCEAT
jgi:hypothetical protein